MAIKVARGVVTRIRDHSDGFVLQVREADDEERAMAALVAARMELIELIDPSLITDPLPSGDGPWIAIDANDTSARLLRAVPEVIASALERAGVCDALIAATPAGDGPLARTISGVPRAAVLRLFPPPPPARQPPILSPPLADGWLAEALAWVGAGLDADEELGALLDGQIEFSLRMGDAPGFFEQLRDSDGESMSAVFVAGDLAARIRAVNLAFNGGLRPNLALSAGGPDTSDGELLEHFEGLKQVARRLAPELAYAFVSLEGHFQAFGGADHWPPWNRARGSERSWYSVNHVCDEVCVEAFPYQVLSPGHLARLGGTPAGARPLAAGRVELALGDPYAWLVPGSPQREGAVASAREVLAPCLGDVEPILLERLLEHEGT